MYLLGALALICLLSAPERLKKRTRDLVANPEHHHPDSFDRMLIVQARSEGLTIVTPDALFSAYDVLTLDC